jgi:hypothetical protein
MPKPTVLALCAVAYVSIHAAGVGAAWSLRGGAAMWKGCARWLCGVMYVGTLAMLKLVVLRGLFVDSDMGAVWAAAAFAFAATALWECSNGALIFGGAALQTAHGITTLSALCAAWAVPAQVNVLRAQPAGASIEGLERLVAHGAHPAATAAARRRHHHHPTWQRLAVRGAQVGTYLTCGCLLRLAVRELCGATDGWSIPAFVRTVMEVEAVVMMGACFVHALNVLPLLAQAVALVAVRATQQSGIQVIYPYGSFYFVSTTRAFWARWSRPAGQLIRRMLYTPLQGRRLCPAWVLVPFVFLLNAQSHFLITIVVRRPAPSADAHAKMTFYLALLGHWVLAYGVLAAAAVLETVLDPCVAPSRFGIVHVSVNMPDDDGLPTSDGPARAASAPPLPVWYCVVRGAVAHAALRVAAYSCVYGVFGASVHSFL